MDRIAKELGLVGGEQIHHFRQLLARRLPFHAIEVFVEALQSEGSQASSQPSLDQVLLAFLEMDAAGAVDQTRNAVEFPLRQGEHPNSVIRAEMTIHGRRRL